MTESEKMVLGKLFNPADKSLLFTLARAEWLQRSLNKAPLWAQGRKDIPEDYRQTYIDSVINDNKDTSYTEQDVIDTMFLGIGTSPHRRKYLHI